MATRTKTFCPTSPPPRPPVRGEKCDRCGKWYDEGGQWQLWSKNGRVLCIYCFDRAKGRQTVGRCSR